MSEEAETENKYLNKSISLNILSSVLVQTVVHEIYLWRSTALRNGAIDKTRAEYTYLDERKEIWGKETEKKEN
jgi:hypothetical protein